MKYNNYVIFESNTALTVSRAIMFMIGLCLALYQSYIPFDMIDKFELQCDGESISYHYNQYTLHYNQFLALKYNKHVYCFNIISALYMTVFIIATPFVCAYEMYLTENNGKIIIIVELILYILLLCI